MSAAPKPALALPLHDPSQWPMRMTRDEVAHVCRRSRRWLEIRIARGEFPPPDGDRMWARATVRRYVEGGIQQFDQAARSARRGRATTRRRLPVMSPGPAAAPVMTLTPSTTPGDEMRIPCPRA